MSRVPARYTQALLVRAIRAMQKVFGTAAVVFETDGRIRVTAGEGPTATAPRDTSWDDVIDLGPWIPEPVRQLTDEDIKDLHSKFPHRPGEWMRAVPKQPFHKLESDALEHLARHGVGVPVRFSTIPRCGPDTALKLLVRGYVELQYRDGAPEQIDKLSLTAAGSKALKPPGARWVP